MNLSTSSHRAYAPTNVFLDINVPLFVLVWRWVHERCFASWHTLFVSTIFVHLVSWLSPQESFAACSSTGTGEDPLLCIG